MNRQAARPSTGKLSGRFAATVGPLRARWLALSARERHLSTLAASAVGLLLVWAIALAPALRTLEKVRKQRLLLDGQTQQMLALQAEARQLAAQPRIGREVALKALQESVAGLGTGAQMQVSGDRATIILRGVSAVNVASWIGQARTNARVAPVEARLVRSAARTNTATATATAPPGSALAGSRPPGTVPGAPAVPPAAAVRTNDDIRWDGTLVVALPAG